MNRNKRLLPEEDRRAIDAVELALTELAKLEQGLRERSRAAIVNQDEARRQDRHSSRAFWSGVAEAYRMAAGDVALSYLKVEGIHERK